MKVTLNQILAGGGGIGMALKVKMALENNTCSTRNNDIKCKSKTKHQTVYNNNKKNLPSSVSVNHGNDFFQSGSTPDFRWPAPILLLGCPLSTSVSKLLDFFEKKLEIGVSDFRFGIFWT